MKKLMILVALLSIVGLSVAADAPAKAAPAAPPAKTAPAAPPAKAATAATKDAGGSTTAHLMNPAALTEKAPDAFDAVFETTKGNFTIHVVREWSPNGADRMYNLVKSGYYNGVKFFRVISGFMVQFGINGDPKVNTVWREATIQDDAVKQSNKRGFVTFAKSGAPNSRTTQIFINFVDRNSNLDSMGFSPFGQVSSGMDIVDKIYAEYGEGAPRGRGPDQGKVQSEGNAYLEKDFPNMDSVKKAYIGK